MKNILWVRDVEEFLFCPMVFYFSVALGMGRDTGLWAELGKEIQKDAESQIERRFEIFAREFEVESERLRVKGRIDFVVKAEDELVPLEIKYSSSVKPWWRYSLVLYALLLEDRLRKPVKFGYLYLTESDKIVRIDVSDGDRAFVERAVNECHKILRGKAPKPSKSKSCKNCDFKDVCSEFS